MKKALLIIIAVLIGGFLLIQLAPYGRDHTNPPVVQEPAWDSPQTRDLAMRACADCHSNTTVWPWYSNIAPVSWLVYRHTEEGRSKMNFSEWNRPQRDADEAAEVVSEGEMPLATYVMMHKSAQLTPAEKDALIQGLQATFGGEAGQGGDGD
jgi:mono/diheme cytochrome c family protein